MRNTYTHKCHPKLKRILVIQIMMLENIPHTLITAHLRSHINYEKQILFFLSHKQ